MSSYALNVRIPQEIKELLGKVANDRGEDVSDFVRRALLKELASLNFLSEEQKKALGV